MRVFLQEFFYGGFFCSLFFFGSLAALRELGCIQMIPFCFFMQFISRIDLYAITVPNAVPRSVYVGLETMVTMMMMM